MGDDDCLDLTWIAARRLCEFNPEVQDAVELMMDGRMLPLVLMRLYLALVHYGPRNSLDPCPNYPSFGAGAPRIFHAFDIERFLATEWADSSDRLARAKYVWGNELEAHNVAYFIVHHGSFRHYSTVCVDWQHSMIMSYDSIGQIPANLQHKLTSTLATLGLEPPLDWVHVSDTRQAFDSLDCLLFSLHFVERNMASRPRYSERDLPLAKYAELFREDIRDYPRRLLFLDLITVRFH